MASRIWRFILMLSVMASAMPVVAETATDVSAGEGAVLDPRIERRKVKEANIDAENFEVGAYAGLISLQEFGVSSLVGAQIAYHVSEDAFFEFNVAKAKGSETNFEKLSAGVELLDDSERDFLTWHFNIAYQLLPGEAFLGDGRAFNTGLYFTGGAGSTKFAADNRFTVNVGAGYRVLLNDWLSVRMELRDYIYQIDTFGEDQLTQNLAWTLGMTGFF